MDDLSNMTPGIVIGKLVAFEMSRKMGQEEASSSSKGKALACSEKKKMKGKQVETSSSSSSSSEDEEEDEDDDDDDEDSSEDDQSSSSREPCLAFLRTSSSSHRAGVPGRMSLVGSECAGQRRAVSIL